MKALLKNERKWVDIETSSIFSNQYNTTDGRRIFDCNIIRIYEDVRVLNPQICECGYCGKVFFTDEEYERHLEEEKKLARKDCSSCFWASVRTEKEVLDEEVSDTRKSSKKSIGCYGDAWENIHTERRVIKEKCIAVCRHEEEYGCCIHVCHAEDGLKFKKYFSKAYFVSHPYADLFDSFNDDSKEFSMAFMDEDKSKRNFSFHLDEQNLNLHVVGTLRKKVFIDKVFSYDKGYPSLIEALTGMKERPRSTLLPNNKEWDRYLYGQNVQKFAEERVSLFKYSVKLYNRRVTDDFLYTQPDGRVLNEVVIDGKTVKRPLPLSYPWMD